MVIKLSLEEIDELGSEAIAIGLLHNKMPFTSLLSYLDWRLCGEITRLAKLNALPHQFGEKVLLCTQGRIKPTKIFLFGLMQGENQRTPSPLKRVDWMIDTLQRAKVYSCTFSLPATQEFEEATKALGEATTLPFKNLGVFA